MALIVTCPHCKAKLKTKQRIACGDPATCPKCKREFIAAGIVEESTRPDLPPVLPASHPQSALPVREDPKPHSSRRVEPEEESRGRDEEMIAARYQWQSSNDSSSKRSRFDDDDNKPSGSRSRYDEDRSARDRDDRADRSRRRRNVSRRRRTRRGKNRNVLYFALSFAGALALMVIVLLIVHLADKGDVDEEMLAFMPSDTVVLMGAELDEFSKIGTRFPGGDASFLNDLVFPRDDIQRVILGISESNDSVLVMRMKNSFSRTRFKDRCRDEEKRENGKTYYPLRNDTGFAHLHSNSLVLITVKESTMREILRRDNNKLTIAESLRDLAKAGSDASFWFASTGEGAPFGVGRAPILGNGFAGDEIRGVCVSLKIRSDTLEVKVAALAKDGDTASNLRARMQDYLDEHKRRFDSENRHSPRLSERQQMERDNINSASVERSGLMVVFTCQGKNPRADAGDGNRDLFQMFR